ncbi:DUF4892 domain-containing protein [Pseudomonas sp. RIT-PI-AD]|uniref:DUF4892 domain-containing protein n=1 Tax=Pseudomonas sp. RIT-PI-AD TaxID=3035294 RepID=UPI0021DA0A2C|nr:DUF4892 domain-containing protein [Pseudomonas sp. RIT-PI-AD]
MRSYLPALLGLLSLASVQAAEPPGSHDPETLPRYPQAEIAVFKEGDAVERIYPLGPIRRISNQLRYERKVDVQGRQTAVTYLLPSGHSATEAFDFARQALLAQGAEPLYWCQGRDCGSSSLWANTVFGNPILYGSDDEQAYLLLRLASPRQDSLLALYSITRGNRRAYLHAEQLDASAPLGDLLPNAATLLRELRASGTLTLQQATGEPEAPWLELLAQTLRTDTSLRVAIAGPAAERWREALVEAGVRSARLELDETPSERLRLTWLR